MKTSIEVEYWVINGDGRLTAPGDLTEISEQIEEEFVEPLLEIKTTPCCTIDELRDDLVGQLRSAVEAARTRDLHFIPLGTPLSDGSIEYRSCRRTAIQRRVLGESFDHAKHCAGTHVHFEQENALEQMNTLTALDPAFALLNSSPYYRGERAQACARPYNYRKVCYGEYPEYGQLREYAESIEGRERELEQRFAEFKRMAVEEGVSPGDVDELFQPDDTVWSPVRLRKQFPTVEWRSPDAALPSQVLQLVSEMKPIVDATDEKPVSIGEDVGVDADGITLPPFETLERYVEEAMRNGLDSPPVAAYLRRMGLTPSRYQPIGSEIDGRETLSPRTARKLRLRYARRLERDIEQLSTSDEDEGWSARAAASNVPI